MLVHVLAVMLPEDPMLAPNAGALLLVMVYSPHVLSLTRNAVYPVPDVEAV